MPQIISYIKRAITAATAVILFILLMAVALTSLESFAIIPSQLFLPIFKAAIAVPTAIAAVVVVVNREGNSLRWILRSGTLFLMILLQVMLFVYLAFASVEREMAWVSPALSVTFILFWALWLLLRDNNSLSGAKSATASQKGKFCLWILLLAVIPLFASIVCGILIAIVQTDPFAGFLIASPLFAPMISAVMLLSYSQYALFEKAANNSKF
ncbi:MAG: hypothetical protein FWC86_06295 [Coriobacteriia bacterium]|nr:hypothetical protein [Coriobacteriia bacterium]